MPPENTKHLYKLNDWTLNSHTNQLFNETDSVLLEHRHTCLLIYFLEHSNQILKKDQILQAVWQNKVVNDESLAVAVSQLRKALGDNARSPRYIKTIPGVGYQFISSLSTEIANGISTELSPEPISTGLSPEPSSAPAELSNAAEEIITRNGSKLYYLQLKWITVFCLFLLVITTSWIITRPEHKPADLLTESFLLLQSENDKDLRKAIFHFKKILSEQPENAEAYLGIAEAKMKLLGSDVVRDENYNEVTGFLRKALHYKSELARAHLWLANLVRWHDLDYQSAEEHYKKGLEINPNDELILAHYTHFLLVQKRFKEVDQQVQQKRELNPLNYSRVDMAWVFLLENQFGRAEKELNRIAKTETMDFYFHQVAENVYYHLGKEQEAYTHLKWFFKQAGFDEKRVQEFDGLFTKSGLKAVYTQLLAQKETADLGHHTPPLSWARYALASGQKEQALTFLKQAIKQRQPHAECLADPLYYPLLNDHSIKPFSEKILQRQTYVEPR